MCREKWSQKCGKGEEVVVLGMVVIYSWLLVSMRKEHEWGLVRLVSILLGVRQCQLLQIEEGVRQSGGKEGIVGRYEGMRDE